MRSSLRKRRRTSNDGARVFVTSVPSTDQVKAEYVVTSCATQPLFQQNPPWNGTGRVARVREHGTRLDGLSGRMRVSSLRVPAGTSLRGRRCYPCVSLRGCFVG